VGSRPALCGRRRHPDVERALYFARLRNAHTNTDSADTNSDSKPYPHFDSASADTNSNSVPHANAVANTHGHTTANSYSYANPKSYSYTHNDAEPNADSDIHSDPCNCRLL
jgi:hypothetical protein